MKHTVPPASRVQSARRLALAAAAAVAGLSAIPVSAQTTPPSAGDRVLGLDVSAWQGNIAQTTWNNIRNVENRRFVFIRSSRGGTTGYYDQSNADNDPPTNTLSQRYDDPYFVQNITRATTAGMLAGPYHFSRPDVIASTINSNGIPNNGTDEADHFIQMAGAWMRPGYLLPVHDFEAGDAERSNDQLAQFVIDFSNRLNQVTGIRPIVYASGNYANILQNTTASLRSQVIATNPYLWSARWPAGSGNQYFGDVQNEHPKDTISYIYGPWDDSGATHPWSFWQYASGGRLESFNSGNSNLDFNVAQGNMEFLKDHLVPALWVSSASGDWSSLANWNSGQAPVAPVQGPGQVPRVGSLTLPAVRLPGADDTVNLNRPNENVTVTLSTGTHTIRRLNLSERLNVTGGTLNVGMTGFALSGGTLSLSGGTVNVEQANFATGSALDFAGPGTLNVGFIQLGTGVTFTGASGTGVLAPASGAAGTAFIQLNGGTRSLNVGDGASPVDLRVALPFTNGTLAKDGAGTLELTANNTGTTANVVVNNGHLLLTANNQLGVNGVRTTQSASNAVGGTVRLSGTNLTYGVPITLGGTGFNNAGALENLSGNNTWSGSVTLNGAQNNQNQPGLNQIAAAAGTTLTLSGVVRSGTGGSWAKLGEGDVVLAGASPNTYANLTRVFAGRLIVEKDGALGAAGSNTLADGNTFQLPGTVSTIAFRAPAGSAGLSYSAVEWIHTEGAGVGGLGQIDNLGGDNVFAGHLGLGGPEVGGVQQASIGVSAGSLEVKGGLYARTIVAPAPRAVTKLGAGTLILSGDSGPAPTNNSDRALVDSTFNVDAGTVRLNGTAGDAANVPGVAAWNVNGASSKLSLGRTGATGTAALTLDGGTLHTDVAGVNVAGPVSLPGGGTVETAGAGASLTLAGPVGGTALAKTGTGTLTLAAGNTYAGGTTVQVGTLVAGHADALGAGPLTVASGATLRAQVGLPAALDLPAPLGMSASGTAGGTLDLADNALALRHDDASAAAAGHAVVNGLVRNASNDFLWNQPGITSTAVQAGVAAGIPVGLGILLNHDGAGNALFYGDGTNLPQYHGRGVDANTVMVGYTLLGDGDLNGIVDSIDFALFQSGFSGGAPYVGWAFGDYDYNGVVDAVDFGLFQAGYQYSQLNPTPEMAAFADEHRLSLVAAAVPEPTTLGLLALGGSAGLLVRRRRRDGR